MDIPRNTRRSGIDMRVIKTKKAIKNALTQLMSTKDVSQITPKDIADAALISKKTFFAHYENVYAVLDEMEGEVVSSIADILDSVDFSSGRAAVQALFERLTALIDSDSAFYGSLLKSNTYDRLLARVKEAVESRLEEYLKPRIPDHEKLSYAVGFIAGGIMSAYRQWFNSGRKKSLGEVSDMVGAIATSSVASLTSGT